TTVPVQLELACHTCHGTGAAPGTAPVRCPQCEGTGVVATSQGLFALQQPCPRCHGMGSIVETPCPTCQGSGRERRTKRFTLKIPAGSEEGKLLRIKGRGAPRLKGSGKGDVLARLHLEVPQKMNKQQRELFEQLQKAGG